MKLIYSDETYLPTCLTHWLAIEVIESCIKPPCYPFTTPGILLLQQYQLKTAIVAF